jgi:cell division protein ZapA (FtsZ GTPase activity inhibitor)
MLLTLVKVMGAALAYLTWTILAEDSKNLNILMLMIFLGLLLLFLLTMFALASLKRRIKDLEEKSGMMEGRTRKLEEETENLADMIIEEMDDSSRTFE